MIVIHLSFIVFFLLSYDQQFQQRRHFQQKDRKGVLFQGRSERPEEAGDRIDARSHHRDREQRTEGAVVDEVNQIEGRKKDDQKNADEAVDSLVG